MKVPTQSAPIAYSAALAGALLLFISAAQAGTALAPDDDTEAFQAQAEADEISAVQSSVNVAEELGDEELRMVLESAQKADPRKADRRPAVLAPAVESLAADIQSD